jgi:hypothetical protein
MVDNGRDHIRIKMHTRIFVEVEAASDTSKSVLLQCNVVDVSYSGFRVNVERELIQGSILSVCAELPAVEEPFYMTAEVKWCRPNEDGNSDWLAGFEILKSRDTDIDSWRELLEHI